MRALFSVFIICTLGIALLASCSKEPVTDPGASLQTAMLGQAALDKSSGNGFPSGPHYNLNIIGVPKGKTADMTGDEGHRIFVSLSGNSKIMLSPGDDFSVLDANATDGPAAFQLPNPDPDGDGVTAYSVYARALGTPGGSTTMTTCAEDSLGNTYCSSDQLVLVRSKGQSKAINVSRELLYIYVDLNGDGTPELYPLFDDALMNYFWSYDNNGCKLVQLRFYMIPTDVNQDGGIRPVS